MTMSHIFSFGGLRLFKYIIPPNAPNKTMIIHQYLKMFVE